MHWLLTALCTAALALALAAFVRASMDGRRVRNLATSVDLARVETLIADLRADYLELIESHKRLRSRTGMREKRERDKDATDDPQEWKRQMRLKIAKGSL